MENDLETRIRELKYREGDPFWEAFRLSAKEMVDDVQKDVNNLSKWGPDHDADRVRLNVWLAIASGDTLDSMVTVLEGRLLAENKKIEKERLAATADESINFNAR